MACRLATRDRLGIPDVVAAGSRVSWKHDPPTAVEAIRRDTDTRVDADDVVDGLADPLPAPRPVTASRDLAGDDPLLAIAPDMYVRRLLGVEVPRHRKIPCPFHDDRRESLHVYSTAEPGWY
jgi:hypothetical protein